MNARRDVADTTADDIADALNVLAATCTSGNCVYRVNDLEVRSSRDFFTGRVDMTIRARFLPGPAMDHLSDGLL